MVVLNQLSLGEFICRSRLLDHLTIPLRFSPPKTCKWSFSSLFLNTTSIQLSSLCAILVLVRKRERERRQILTHCRHLAKSMLMNCFKIKFYEKPTCFYRDIWELHLTSPSLYYSRSLRSILVALNLYINWIPSSHQKKCFCTQN